MPAFRLTELATQDLLSIGRYTQKTWGTEQRNRYLAILDDCFHLLAREPHRGRTCDDIRSGYRKYHIGRHLIFYQETNKTIDIIRILHDRMDVESYFNED
ncbi:type II toxin-antitoxin system RelE/ParE family toxin [Nostoc sp.]|uniref:type II toxin-antitoxin system RelE/ParE family toxin n=1 Tax=Nostoc sp. TaxID=1180 RepID=UPI002FFCB6C1